MVHDHWINDMLIVAFDSTTGEPIAVRCLGSTTGEEIIKILPILSQRLEPPSAPEIKEPEPPQKKKSYQQRQKELPKFLRPRRDRSDTR
jgi:hypothetical protein